jgi:hypothetical protein
VNTVDNINKIVLMLFSVAVLVYVLILGWKLTRSNAWPHRKQEDEDD